MKLYTFKYFGSKIKKKPFEYKDSQRLGLYWETLWAIFLKYTTIPLNQNFGAVVIHFGFKQVWVLPPFLKVNN